MLMAAVIKLLTPAASDGAISSRHVLELSLMLQGANSSANEEQRTENTSKK
ncbi:hypothetical protein NQZ68_005530 [Dissostichus eleginoides]|nr:hypothetical protein NQZ68_005530 [Dissostichus eleginoides]